MCFNSHHTENHTPSFVHLLGVGVLLLTVLLLKTPKAYAAALFSDTFSGSTIDASKWIEHDTGSNVNQNNALTVTGSTAWMANGVETQSTFSRNNSLTIVTRVSVGTAAKDYIVMGYGDWSWIGAGKSTYIVYLHNSGTIYFQYWNNASSVQSVTAGTYTSGVTYNFKMVLQATGANLYVDSGGGYPGTPTAQLTQGTFTDKKVNIETYTASMTQTVTSVMVTDSTESMSDVTSLTVTPGANQNVITWTNPSDSNFTGTMIRYRTDTYPTSTSNGTLLVDQNGSPSGSESYTHTGLGGGITYYYTLFAHSVTPVYGLGANASGLALGAPNNVTGLQAISGNENVTLSWTNPTSTTLTGVMIRYRTDTYPTSTTDGTLAVDQAATSGAADSYTVTGLTNATTYYFTAFAHNAVPQYASGTNVSETPYPLVLSDTFSAGSLNTTLWTAIGSAVTQTGDGYAGIGAPGASGWDASGIKSVNTYNRASLVITTRAKFSSIASKSYAPIGYGDSDAGKVGGGEAIWLVADQATTTFHCLYSSNGSNSVDTDSSISFIADTFYTFRLTVDDTSGGTFEVDSGAGYVSACTVASGTFTNKRIFLETNTTGSTMTVDSVQATGTLGASVVTFTNPTANRTIHDQDYDFAIPWIQTSTTLTVTATATNIPSGGGIKFVLDEGTANAATQTDLSSPYSVTFSGLAKAEHTLRAYSLDSDGVTQLSGGPHGSLSSIAVGDIIVLIGDSTTAGHAGSQTAGNVTTCAGATYKTSDCRTYEQRDGDSGETWASFHVGLATKLAAYYGYPVFIMNEGWGGDNTDHFNATISQAAQFQNRMTDLQPTLWLINEGVNDARCQVSGCSYQPSGPLTAAAFQTRLQTLVNTIKTGYGAANSQLYIARYSYDTSLTSVASDYLGAISTVIANNAGIRNGANLYDYIKNHQEYLTDIVHPNAAGFTQEARIWAITLMSPQNVAVSQNAGTVTVSWSSLTASESTINGYKVKYGTTSGTYTTTVDAGNVTSRTINGLTDGQTYYFTVSAYDNDATLVNETQNSQEVSLTYDSTAPTISSVSSGTPTTTGTTITWTTNGNASTKVEYGLTTSYGSTTAETDTVTRVTSHSSALSGLTSCTTYHYRVRSKDAALNETISTDASFTTAGCTGSASITDQTASTILTAAGGSVSLLTDSNGITLTIPVAFAGTDATFQIKQLDTTAVNSATTVPAGYMEVGSYVYDLKALSDVSTAISSFNNPITVSIAYNASDVSGINESTLTIYRWDGSDWNQLPGCVVDATAKTVTCTTTAFSLFKLFGQAGASSSSKPTLSTSPISAKPCGEQPPGNKTPWLFSAIPQNSESILLYFTPADSPVTTYVLEYGTSSGAYPWGIQDMGVNSRDAMTFLVHALQPNTLYYFRVRGGNGCASGNWSNEISARTKSIVAAHTLAITSSEITPFISEMQLSDTFDQTQTIEDYTVKVKVVNAQNESVAGATVTLHSTPREAVTNEDGTAVFQNVESGQHQVLIAYDGYKGEQTINVAGEVKKFDLTIKVQKNLFSLSPVVYGVFGVMAITIIVLALLLAKARKRS